MRQWVAAKFDGTPRTSAAGERIEVLANHGPVQPNARGDKPMHIGVTGYVRGLYCHAPSKVAVHLPGPGRTFEAMAGVDTNDNTSGGRGSVVFSVRVGDTEKWSSGVVREGMPALPVSVDLGSAMDFVLEVGDAGDGISCDQADWVDAKVTLANGSVLWLGDLPLRGPQRGAYTSDPFFAFKYGGQPSSELLPTWKLERISRLLDAAHTEHTLLNTDPATGLQVRCVGIEYLDFPTVEWTVYFKNTGVADTPILSELQALDTRFERDDAGEFTLHHHTGDICAPDSYEPHSETLAPKANKRIANTGGRPTQSAFPYFNIEWPGEGIICVVSWAGQWAAQFARDDANGLRLRAGQELTHFTLHPGEEVRGPMIVLQFYKGGWLRAQNVWRRWMFAHNVPRPGGKPLAPQSSLCTGNFYPNLMTEAVQERSFLERHMAEGIQFDCWWQAAGWYPCDGVGWPKTGTWEVDPVRFPKGLRELSDLMHEHGKKTMVWFEPERVHPGTWIAENHPEWVHGGKNGGLLRLGDPACRAWLTDHIDRLLTEQGIDYYRQDFNIDPLSFWRANDTEDRQGITEIRHIEGYFAYWDELLRRHPGMLIDSCASGGRRNDLETLRRAVPLLRSDWYNNPGGQQCLTYGLSLWIPYHGTGVIYERDEYWVRSSMVAEMSYGPDAKGVEKFD
ncbi:MAG: NPCBM/NEW2 domain-containing protein, partial [Candidatus Hydrogenedentes bacterium]|nr:NPCBM/NEW2 domain-containing protein [Candidatus Hydrogenedentota bacterium]